MTTVDIVVWAVIAARFFAPLLIPFFPLLGVIASVAIDAADGSLFETLLGTTPPRYQPYDKAMDVFSLSVTMLAILRNWENLAAVRIARFLFYYRLVGVVVFELSGKRWMLLIFPNTFEYFFISYEIVCVWWSPARLRVRALLGAAAFIWVGIKIPHEYWLHVAKLDVTELIREKIFRVPATVRWADPVAQIMSGVGVIAIVFAAALVVRRFAPRPEHPRKLAADPLPISIDEERERARYVAKHWRVLDLHVLEKVLLVGFLTVIFAQIIPGITARPPQLVIGVAALVLMNSFVRLRWAKRGWSIQSGVLSFLALAVTNGMFIFGADYLLGQGSGGELPVYVALFFLLLISLIVTLYDRWHAVFDVRFRIVHGER